MRLFIIAAVVLVVFAIVAAASTTGQCLGTTWPVWVAASLLAFYVDLLLGDVLGGFINTQRNRPAQPQTPQV
jgi:hypothetical protein